MGGGGGHKKFYLSGKKKRKKKGGGWVLATPKRQEYETKDGWRWRRFIQTTEEWLTDISTKKIEHHLEMIFYRDEY